MYITWSILSCFPFYGKVFPPWLLLYAVLVPNMQFLLEFINYTHQNVVLYKEITLNPAPIAPCAHQPELESSIS